MTVGDRRTLRGPALYRGQYQPHAPATGDVLGGALANAYALSTTGGLFVGQWWRPLAHRGVFTTGATLVGAREEWNTTVYLPGHWDAVRVHVVFALEHDVPIRVRHTLSVGAVAGEVTERVLTPEVVDFDGGTWMPKQYERLFESQAVADVGASAGSTATVSLVVEAAIVSEASGTPTGRAGYVTLGVTCWGVVR